MAEIYKDKKQPTITHFIILNEDGSLSDPIKIESTVSSDEIFLSNGETIENALNGENTAYRATTDEITQMFNLNRATSER